MPNFNGMGPNNQGPMTGRGLGPCGSGRGFRRGFRRGFGRGRFALETEQVTLTKDQEKKVLESELRNIEAEKSEIEKRLKELKN